MNHGLYYGLVFYHTKGGTADILREAIESE